MRDPWFAQGEPRDLPGVRLFCLPYAGGSAAAYREWNDLTPPLLHVHPLELPGRGARWGDPPVNGLPRLVDMVADGLSEHLDRPYALFGHSMGGLLAFELCRTLRARGLPPPEHLFVSGAAAPELPRTRLPVHTAPHTDVLDELRFLGGTPPEILHDPELMELLLPTLRADFSVLETYRYRSLPPLDVPLTVFGGDADPVVPYDRLHRWQRHTCADARLLVLPGDHFFLHSATVEVLAAIADTLALEAPETVPGRRGHHS
ncbi:alpha/beta fold hydrolase [Streptomyces sp. NPDC005438]|uniref:thioesterase II family protein n=1 Tax=Streptomyces sp. NPDC005438 TaxID=3156880 RepID=UPI0033ABE192